jgi:hypothetical protein
VLDPLARVLGGQAAAVGERRRHRVEPARGGAGEEAAGAVGHGDVDQPGGVDVQDRAALLRRRQGAQHPERGEIDALDGQARALRGGDHALHHLAPHGDDHDADARPGRRVHGAERLHVQHGLLDRHRDVVGGERAGCGEQRLLVVHHRQIERAHDDPLVGDPEPHALGQLVLVEERAQRLRQRRRVGHVAVAQDARGEMDDRAARERERAVAVHLGRGEVAGIELEADEMGLGGALSLEHGRSIGTRRARLDRPW